MQGRDTLQVPDSGNDLDGWALGKFCLVLDRSWRGDSDLAVLSTEDMRNRFFKLVGDDGFEDEVFHHLTAEERAELVYGWHLCGKKMALGYEALKISMIVNDAFRAGDLDSGMFARAIGPELLLSRIPLRAWWGFYRGGCHNKASLQNVLVRANREYNLFDGHWFFANLIIHSKSGAELRGVEALGAILTKSELVDWLVRAHALVVTKAIDENDLLTALTLELFVEKATLSDLLLLVDALAKHLDLVGAIEDLIDSTEDGAPTDTGPDKTAPPASEPAATEPTQTAIGPDGENADTVVPAPRESEPPQPAEAIAKQTRRPTFFDPPTDEEVIAAVDRIEESQPGATLPTEAKPEGDAAAGASVMGAADDDIRFDPEEPPSVQIVDDDELLPDGHEHGDGPGGTGQMVRTGSGDAVIDWGEHPPSRPRDEDVPPTESSSGSSSAKAPRPDPPPSYRRSGSTSGPPPLPKPGK